MACLTPWDKQTARVFDADGCFHALFANSEKSGLARDAVLTIRRSRKACRRVAEGCRGATGEVSCEFASTVRRGNGFLDSNGIIKETR